MRFKGLVLACAMIATGAHAAGPPVFPYPPLSVITDPTPDPKNPAAMVAFQLPSHGAMMNAVLYTAPGSGNHPTMLLLHGLPGNEQNLDLAQAARRTGWNVLTFHYRGSWGSQGTYSFVHCVEDAKAALEWLRAPENVAKYHIGTDRIVVAGHSLGGDVAARVAADDDAIAGAFLIDPADLAAGGRAFAEPGRRQAFIDRELRGDMPPLSGTSIDALADEMAKAPDYLDLVSAAKKLADRPLVIVGATRGVAFWGKAAADAAIAAGGNWVHYYEWPTDHSFSDMRIALAARLNDWLWTVPPRNMSFTGPGWKDSNTFARIARGEIRVAKVYEDKYVLAFMDNHPVSPGHVLVISKVAHARNVMEMDPANLSRLMLVARRIAIAQREVFHPTGIVIQQNSGNAGSIPHLHVHVYPAYDDVPSLSSLPPEASLDDLKPIAAKIAAALPK